MIEYIYFVKCPNCEDEHFYFFNDAKECAMSQLSKKPIITQTEVNRNDFGECTDSCDLGTVWSWEDMMNDVPADSEQTTFSKVDTVECDNCFDPEFDALDNSLDEVPDNSRKPVPADMSIEDLVEAMEENEDDVECKSCNELFDKSECRHDADYGWLCSRCQRAIEDHGAALTLTEASKYRNSVELHYDSLTTEITTKVIPATRLDPEEYEEGEYTDEYDFEVETDRVTDAIWENFITEEDVKDVPGGLAALEDETAWEAFLETNLDVLLDKYNDQLLAFFREEAEKAAVDEFQDRYAELHGEGPDPDRAYDEWRDSQYFEEECPRRTVEEELKWHTYKITYTTPANPDRDQTTMFKTWKFDVEYAWRMSRENIPHSTIKRIELVEGLSESIDQHDLVELEYPSLTVTLYGEKRAEDDWDEFEHTDSHVFLVPKVEVATAIWENWITEEDAKDVLGGLKTLEDDRLWELYLETHFDDLFEKYNKQILEYFKEEATEDFRERSQEESQLNSWSAKQKRVYAALEDDFNESTQKPFLEEFDDAETHKASLTDCPECGSVSYDMKEQYCTNCGLNL